LPAPLAPRYIAQRASENAIFVARSQEEKNVSDEDSMKIGDKVRRKGGGPDMTVVDVEESDSGKLTIHCVWYDGKNKEQQGQFPADKLVLL
jgi:uncharacterized protein YodC (DUF2158 family)